MKDLIDQHTLIVCTGSGGVGKTTTSAALGVAAAKQGKRALVLTIDPAQRLATSLGIAKRLDDVRVPRQDFSGELWAGMIDPAAIFAEYIERHAESREIAERLMATRLYQQLSTTLSGSQEFTSLSRVYDAVQGGKYDLVILDTPPATHAIEFLKAPEQLNVIFESTVVSLFMGRASGLNSGMGLAAVAWKQWMKMALTAFSMLTGSEFVALFRDFFTAVDAIAPAIRETNLAAHKMLLAPSTAFVLVSSYDAAKIQEGEAYFDELERCGYHLRQVIINRAWPHWMQADGATHAEAQVALAAADPALARLHAELRGYYEQRRRTPTRFTDIVAMPEMDEDVVGLTALEAVADRLMAAHPLVTYPVAEA